MIKVLIADDHALMRNGLRGMLEAEDDIEVIGELAAATALPLNVMMMPEAPSVARLAAAGVPAPEVLAVAEALADYVDVGASALLIRGYEPLADAEAYGRELIPRVREIVRARRLATATTG